MTAKEVMWRLKQFAMIAAAMPAVAVMVSFMPEDKAIALAVRAALVRNQDEPGIRISKLDTFSAHPCAWRLSPQCQRAALGSDIRGCRML